MPHSSLTLGLVGLGLKFGGKFGSGKNLGPEKNFGPEKNLRPEKNLGPEKKLGPEKNLGGRVGGWIRHKIVPTSSHNPFGFFPQVRVWQYSQ